MVKKLPVNAGDIIDEGSIPGSRRSSGIGDGTHSSILGWRVAWTEGYNLQGHKESDTTEVT